MSSVPKSECNLCDRAVPRRVLFDTLNTGLVCLKCGQKGRSDDGIRIEGYASELPDVSSQEGPPPVQRFEMF